MEFIIKNNFSQLAFGFLFGILITVLGAFLFTLYIDKGSFIVTVKFMYYHNSLGKLITLGALFNVALVYFLFKKDKDQIAKGVIVSLIAITLSTLFI